MTTLNVQEIINKVNYEHTEYEEPYECDNRPNPFAKLTLDELLYLKNHQDIFDIVVEQKKQNRLLKKNE